MKLIPIAEPQPVIRTKQNYNIILTSAEGCTCVKFNVHMNYNASYTDMMLFKKHAA